MLSFAGALRAIHYQARSCKRLLVLAIRMGTGSVLGYNSG
jgi:hypothetical protein